MQWQSQRTGFSLVWVLRFSALNRMFHKGPLGWPLPALSSCKERPGMGGREEKLFSVSFSALSRNPVALLTPCF